MIEFQTIQWKNLLSYGNNFSTFNFKTGINRIQAENGMGKSSIIDALYFALFGKPYRKIKKGQLINAKNKKGLQVILTFNKQDDVYRIERSMKPDKFEIFKNKEIIPVSSTKRGYQTILEEDILGFNENLCNQVIIKSLTKGDAFMTLEKKDKRAIIENLFDIELFTIINKNAKKRVDAVEVKIKDTKKDLDNTDLLIEQEEANLEKLRILRKKLQEEAESMVAGFTKEIEDMTAENEKFKQGMVIIEKKKEVKKDLSQKVSELNVKRNEMVQANAERHGEIKANDSKVEYLTKVCGDCPKIKGMLEDQNIKEIQEEIALTEAEIGSILVKRDKLVQDIAKVDEILSNERFVTSKLQTNNQRIVQLNQQIKAVQEKVITVDDSKLKEYNAKKVELSETYNSLCVDRDHYLVLRGLFQDDGIKPLIVKKYLPAINRLLNTYLAKFNANMLLNFNEDFNEVILTKNKEDYSYYNFSEGEKKRIDLAILFSFIKFAMHKNQKSNTNLLIFDEIMSGLDFHGATSLFSILKEHKDYENKCVVTINHNSDLDNSYFNYMYEVVNEKGFSRILEN